MFKKGQSGIFIGLIGFWLILGMGMTLYSYSDFPAIRGLGGSINATVISSNINGTVTQEGEEGFWGFFVTLGHIIKFILIFAATIISLLTYWFPVFDSVIVTMVVGTFFLILKVATWWVLVRFWV